MHRSRSSFAPALAASAALALVGLASCPAQAQFVVTNFQNIDPPFAAPAPNPDDLVSQAVGISNNGAIVGVYEDTDSPTTPSQRGYILQNGVYTSVSYPAQAGTLFNSTILRGINNSGVSTGLYQTFNAAGQLVSQTNFIRSGAGVFSTPTVTPTATGMITLFGGINDAGIAATQYTDGGRTHAALYNTNTNTFAALLPDFITGGNTLIQTINNNGDIVGSYDNGQMGAAIQAFIYRNGAYTNISYNAPGATATRFNGINSAGIVSGRYLDSIGIWTATGYRTACCTTATMVSFPPLTFRAQPKQFWGRAASTIPTKSQARILIRTAFPTVSAPVPSVRPNRPRLPC